MIKKYIEKVRFNELKRYLKNISDKTFSINLKELEADHLMEVLDLLCVWGEKNHEV